MMSVFQNKPYPTKLPPVKSKQPDRKVDVAKIKEVKKQEDKFHNLAEMVEKNVVYGKVSILDAHRSQCRWIEGVGKMVCGDPIVNNSSWCKVHYLRVFTPVSVAKAAALEARKRREIEKWPERKRF